MSVAVLVPQAGESVTEGELAVWHKENGAAVTVDEIIAEVETDKASLEIRAPVAGTLSVLVEIGSTVTVGQKIAAITAGVAAAGASTAKAAPVSSAIASAASTSSAEPAAAAVSSTAAPAALTNTQALHATPAARKLMREHDLSAQTVAQHAGAAALPRGRIHAETIQTALAQGAATPAVPSSSAAAAPVAVVAGDRDDSGDRGETRHRLTRLRATIAKRLVLSQQTGALLSTFNEVDMFALAQLRTRYKEQFKKKYEIGLGYMSFFVKAATLALREFPVINSRMEATEIIEPHYIDIGVAVATPKGLVVPSLKNADTLSFHEIEKQIKNLALRGRDSKLTLEELSGGTFTITNGGVFGSMLSTPIVNYPQSAILGMHNIVERPVAVKGEVLIHPVMYTALSYDHRLIDGADAVRFLYRIKELIEAPERLLIKV